MEKQITDTDLYLSLISTVSLLEERGWKVRLSPQFGPQVEVFREKTVFLTANGETTEVLTA